MITTVQMRKSAPALSYESYEPWDMDKKGMVIGHKGWQMYFEGKHDFVSNYVIVSGVGNRLDFLEFKENLYRVTAGQVSAYLKIPYIAKDRFSVIPCTIVAKPVNVYYANSDAINALLGIKGKEILNKVLSLIQEEAAKEEWPLKEIEVCSTKDFEVNEWEYILMILHFNSTFEIADEYLCGLYEKIDTLSNSFDKEGQEILQRDIYFDVRTFIPAD